MANYTSNYNLYLPSRNDSDIEVDTSLSNNFTEIDTAINNNATQLADIVTVDVERFPLQIPEVDDTARVQRAVNTLKANSVLLFSKTYTISEVLFPAIQNVLITGKGTINSAVGTYTANLHFVQNSYNVIIKGLNFIGLQGVTGAPTTYTPNQNVMIKIDDGCGYFTVEKNYFQNHMGHFVIVGAVSGNDVEMGHTIFNNTFRNMTDLSDNRQCALLLQTNCQYSQIMHNRFYNCKSAIHCFSANNKINYNNVTGGSLTIVGTMNVLSDYFAAQQGWIVCTFTGDPSLVNSSKMQLIGNKLNHLDGNAPSIMCQSSMSRNESYFDISHNEILVNTNDYAIMVYQSKGTRIQNNSMGKATANAQKSHIALLECIGIQLDKNHFIGDILTATIEGADFYEGINTFDQKTLGAQNYQYNSNPNVTNARRPRIMDYSFMAVSGDGASYSGQHTVKNWTWVKNAAGNYTVTHNIGHTYYTVAVSGFGAIACAKNFTANTFDINVYGLTGGALMDGAVSGVLTIANNRNGGYYNLTVIPENIA